MSNVMKRIILIILFVPFIIPFLPGNSLAYLTPVADGTYHYQEDCYYWIDWYCNDSWSIIQNEIIVDYSYWEDWDPRPYSNLDIKDGIIEFDISSMEGLFTSGQMQAELFLKVLDREHPDRGDRCFRFKNITNLEENGVIEEGDINMTEYLGEVCGDFQHGDMITIDVTSALEHDLFGSAQTNFSGFVIDMGPNWHDRISFYNSTTANSPILCIRDTNSSDDLDGDCISDAMDNCQNHFNPFQEDTYPPQGNGIGDACDCEGDFDCSGGVDADDVSAFLVDFGRSTFNNPCTNASPCNGDVNCNANVDANDVTMFLQDFGRSQFFNPCPPCVAGNWCVYP